MIVVVEECHVRIIEYLWSKTSSYTKFLLLKLIVLLGDVRLWQVDVHNDEIPNRKNRNHSLGLRTAKAMAEGIY